MIMRSPADVLTGTALLGLSVAIGFLMRSFPGGTLEQGMGPAFVPGILTITLAILSILLILKGLIFGRGDDEEGLNTFSFEDVRTLLRPGALCLFVLLYILLLPRAGYVLSTVLFLLAVCTLLRARWLAAVAIAVGLTAGIFFVFEVGLRVPLPTGSFFQG